MMDYRRVVTQQSPPTSVVVIAAFIYLFLDHSIHFFVNHPVFNQSAGVYFSSLRKDPGQVDHLSICLSICRRGRVWSTAGLHVMLFLPSSFSVHKWLNLFVMLILTEKPHCQRDLCMSNMSKSCFGCLFLVCHEQLLNDSRCKSSVCCFCVSAQSVCITFAALRTII